MSKAQTNSDGASIDNELTVESVTKALDRYEDSIGDVWEDDSGYINVQWKNTLLYSIAIDRLNELEGSWTVFHHPSNDDESLIVVYS